MFLVDGVDHQMDLALSAQSVRRSGGTITPDGGSLTTVGWRRIRTWRQDWLAFPNQVIPALRYLAGLAGAMSVPARLPGRRGAGHRPPSSGGVTGRRHGT